MRFLRTLTNALAAAAVGTGYILLLFLQLNPRLSIQPAGLMPLARSVGLFYLVHLTAAFYLILVVRQLAATRPFSPAWLSVTLLTGLWAATAATGFILMVANLWTFGVVLAPETSRAMAGGATVLAASAVLLAVIGIACRKSRIGRGPLAVSAAAVAIASLIVPVVMRGPSRTGPLEARPLDAMPAAVADPTLPQSRVTILAVDAGSLELITGATAEGRLPNFGRVLDAGAVLHLATLHPTSVEAVWSAVATGKLPHKNGVRSSGIYHVPASEDTIRLLPDFCFATRLVRFGFLIEEPHNATAIRTRPFWSILSQQGVSVGISNWPLTYPAPAVRGFVISDAYARLALTASGLDDPALVYPPELRSETLPVIRSLSADPSVVVALRSDNSLEERHQGAGRTDLIHDRLAQILDQSHPAQVTAIRYQSLDPIGHYFLRYAAPSAFGDVTEEERASLGPVLESHYGPIDEAIGRAIDGLGPDDLLLVVSGYGMEPLGFGKRLLERVIGDPDISGTHETAPDGFLMAYGASVAKGRLLRASVVDVVPTLLYFLGLPVGRDMDGYVRTDLFRPEFTAEHPIAFIPTYDR